MSIITGGLVIAGAKARGDGFIPISLPTWREVSGDDIGVVGLANPGGILATDSTPAYEYINGATDKGLRLRWAASNVDKIAVSVPLPPDLDDAQPISFHMMAQMAGATDVPPFTIAAGGEPRERSLRRSRKSAYLSPPPMCRRFPVFSLLN